MAKLSTRCYWVQYEAKWPGDLAYSVRIRGPAEIPGDLMPTHQEFINVIKGVMAEYNRRKNTNLVGECQEGCENEMVKDQAPPWSEWRSIPFKRTLTKGKGEKKIEFEVHGELEIRKRILEGVCMEKEL